jgi:hypothetical protein
LYAFQRAVQRIIFSACIDLSVKNSKQIWSEPKDYADNLKEAVVNLNSWGIDVSIFNLPLCLLPNELHTFARKSISDWKNIYTEICNDCQKKEDCCGLFSTSKRIFEGLSAFNKINSLKFKILCPNLKT